MIAATGFQRGFSCFGNVPGAFSDSVTVTFNPLSVLSKCRPGAPGSFPAVSQPGRPGVFFPSG